MRRQEENHRPRRTRTVRWNKRSKAFSRSSPRAARRGRSRPAYRRDLADATKVLEKPLSSASTADDLERYLAEAPLARPGLGDGRAPVGRAALVLPPSRLIGARGDNPAAELRPRRRRHLPSSLAGRGRAPDRGRKRRQAARPARPGPGRAALRRRPGQRGSRAGAGRHRSREPDRALYLGKGDEDEVARSGARRWTP